MSLVAALIVFIAGAWAGEFRSAARATTSAEFLKLGAGARSAALGGAFVAAAEDATAVYWNPAAISRVERRSVSLMHASYLGDTNYEYLGYVQNGGPYGYFGGGVQYFSPGRLNQTDPTGNTIATFNPYDMTLYWSYSYKSSSGYAFGVSAKMIDSRILNSASAGAVDAGFLSQPYLGDRLRFALVAANLGGDRLRYETVAEKIPMIFSVGSILKLTGRLLATADLRASQDDRPNGAAGLEYWLAEGEVWRLAGRLGFNSQTVGSVDGLNGLSTGFGLTAHGWSVDYAVTLAGALGQVHRLGLAFNF